MEKLTMNVSELAQAMGIARAKAYELAHREDFPKIIVGKRIVIPIEAFREWMNKNAGA